jgi:hypothetical protein
MCVATDTHPNSEFLDEISFFLLAARTARAGRSFPFLFNPGERKNVKQINETTKKRKLKWHTEQPNFQIRKQPRNFNKEYLFTPQKITFDTCLIQFSCTNLSYDRHKRECYRMIKFKKIKLGQLRPTF